MSATPSARRWGSASACTGCPSSASVPVDRRRPAATHPVTSGFLAFVCCVAFAEAAASSSATHPRMAQERPRPLHARQGQGLSVKPAHTTMAEQRMNAWAAPTPRAGASHQRPGRTKPPSPTGSGQCNGDDTGDTADQTSRGGCDMHSASQRACSCQRNDTTHLRSVVLDPASACTVSNRETCNSLPTAGQSVLLAPKSTGPAHVSFGPAAHQKHLLHRSRCISRTPSCRSALLCSTRRLQKGISPGQLSRHWRREPVVSRHWKPPTVKLQDSHIQTPTCRHTVHATDATLTADIQHVQLAYRPSPSIPH